MIQAIRFPAILKHVTNRDVTRCETGADSLVLFSSVPLYEALISIAMCSSGFSERSL